MVRQTTTPSHSLKPARPLLAALFPVGLANDTISVVSTPHLLLPLSLVVVHLVTSTDGQDSISLGILSSSLVQGNGGTDTLNVAGTTTSSSVRGGVAATS